VEGFGVFLDLRKHAGKDLEAQVLLIAQTIGTALKDADFVVETLDETEGDLVVGTAIGGDAVPVTLDHRRELLVGNMTAARPGGFGIRPAVRSASLLEEKGFELGEYFGMSIGPFLYDDVLISVLIDWLLAVFAKYDFGHFESFGGSGGFQYRR
jgi:hypothetical protein